MNVKPMTMLLAMLAGWINREQQQIIEYLKAENSILKDELLKATGKKRILLNDRQRRRLAILGKNLGRKLLGEICCAFSPNTLLKWHRKLVVCYSNIDQRQSLPSFLIDQFYRLFFQGCVPKCVPSLHPWHSSGVRLCFARRHKSFVNSY